MGRLCIGLLMCFVGFGLFLGPVGCDTTPVTEPGTETPPAKDGGPQPEETFPTDSPKPKSCEPQGAGCCLTVKAQIGWTAHTRQAKISIDNWVGVAKHPTKKLLAIADGSSPGVRIWDFEKTPRLTGMLVEHTKSIRSLAFHPTKSILATGSHDKVIRLWDTDKLESLRTLKGHTSVIYSIAFFPAGDKLVSGSEDKTVRIWGVETGTVQRTFSEPKGRISSVHTTSDGEYIAAASSDGKIYIWEVRLNKLHKELSNGTPYSVRFVKDKVSDKEILIAGYTDGKIRMFEMPDGTLIREVQREDKDKNKIKAHNRNVIAIVGLSTEGLFATGDDEGYLRVWKLEDGSYVGEKRVHPTSIRTISQGASSAQVFTSAINGAVAGHALPTGFHFIQISGRIESAHTIQLAGENRLYSTSRERNDIMVWDLDKKRVLARWKGHYNGITGVATSADSKWVASASEDGVLKLWDAKTGKALLDLKGPKLPTRGLAFSPKGDQLVSASYDGKVRVWSVPKGSLTKTLDTDLPPLTHVVYSPSGKYVAAGAENGVAYVWTTSNWKLLHTLKGAAGLVYALTFTKDENQLLTGGADRIVRWWDLGSGKKAKEFKGTYATVIRSIILDDANKLMISTGDSKILIHAMEDNKLLHTFYGHEGVVLSMAYKPSTRTLYSYGVGRVIRAWDLAALSYPEPIKAHDAKVKTVATSPDGKWVATGAEDKLVKIWDSSNGKLAHTLKAHTAAITDVAFSPDSKWLASASFDKTAILWDVAKGTQVRTFKGNLDRVYRVRFSPDGKSLATAGGDWSLRTWNVETGKQIKEMINHKQIVTSTDWTPDSKSLLSASYDKTMLLWGADGKLAEKPKFTSPRIGFSDAIFDQGGKHIISATFDQNIRIWQLSDGRAIRTIKAHEQSVVAIDYHAQAGIASTSFDKIVKQWTFTGLLLRSFEGHKTPPNDVAFSSDGAFLYSVSDGGTLRSWPLLSPQRANYIVDRVGITQGAWGQDPEIYATASLDNTVKLWNLSTYKANTLYLSNDTLRLHWAKKADRLAITIREGGVRVVDGKTRKTIKDIKPQDKTDTFRDASLHPDGDQLATASEDGNVRLWNVTNAQLSDILKGHAKPVHRVTFSDDGKLLASADTSGLVKIWSVADGTATQSWQAHGDIIHDITFNPKGTSLVTASADHTTKVWSLDGKLTQELCLGEQIMQARFRPDGKHLAVSTFHGKLQFFQTADWKLVRTLQQSYVTAQSVSWSPSGDQVISAFQNGNVVRWDVAP